MASKYISLILILFLSTKVDSAGLLERSYEYVMNWGKSLAPSLGMIMDCFGEDDPWSCAKEKAGKMLESWEKDVDKQRRMWQDAADAEVASSGRSMEELPSQLGQEIEESVFSFTDLVNHGVARALSRKHHDSGGIDSITISTGGEKKKMKKKKQKPPKIHLVHPVMMAMKNKEQDRGFSGKVQSWVIGSRTVDKPETNARNDTPDPNARKGREIESVGVREGRGIMSDVWDIGEQALKAMSEQAVENDDADNGLEDKSSSQEQRGKKKKKKKAILKLLILGAVLKAKIGTLLQILSFKLQVKFFLIALIGLGINLARFWLDLKKSHHQQPQKVIYYEHAQHQHHYDHEEEPGWGPWSRSINPPEEADAEIDVDFHNGPSGPYRAQIDRNSPTYVRPVITRV